ncbi:hypothetical protein ACLKA7_006118 [Drosophila subpalustris]
MQMLRVLWANRNQTTEEQRAQVYEVLAQLVVVAVAVCQMGFDVPKSKSSAPKVMQPDQTAATSDGGEEQRGERIRQQEQPHESAT